ASDGRLLVDARGNFGTCIGSGLGGKIYIKKGALELNANGDRAVAVGSFQGDDEIRITNCGLEIDLSISDGVGCGSIEESTIVKFHKCYVKCSISGNNTVGIGSLSGEETLVDILDSFTDFTIRSGDSTCVGALQGATKMTASLASVRVESVGENCLAFGGYSGDAVAFFNGVDVKVKIYNSSGKDCFAKDEDITMINGKCSIFVNDKRIERKLDYKFDKE
ncbi:MAG: hypothetical protein K6E18_04325, partial [Lachnospiraceae bacterium]|nr:hypothetical protein [Lachnospiraceae bacterium]